MKPQLAIGALGFTVSVISGFLYAKPAKHLAHHAEQQLAEHDTSGSPFDRLANIYDDVIGPEERFMWYGLFRKWLLRKAQGDVLEISAGTGRNLPYYRYSNITTLTLTDVSHNMLQQAQDKFFEGLQLQYKYPELAVKILIANAEHLVAEDQQTPVTVPLHKRKYSSSSSSGRSDGSSRGSSSGGNGAETDAAAAAAAAAAERQQQQQQSTGSVWRFRSKQQQQQRLHEEQQQQQQHIASVCVEAAAATDQHNSSSSSSDTLPSAEHIHGSSSNSSSWWRRKQPQQQQQRSPSPCCCHDYSPIAGTSNSCSGRAAAAAEEGSTFAPGSFDTVVDTFGLCSCEDPVKVLQQASRLLKPGGKLLLLEHGKSSWSWLNDYMNQRAPVHYNTYGCWYNRDIEDIVKKAGLQVESFSRWHFGTSYLIVASPATPEAAAAAAVRTTSQEAAGAAAVEVQASRRASAAA